MFVTGCLIQYVVTFYGQAYTPLFMTLSLGGRFGDVPLGTPRCDSFMC